MIPTSLLHTSLELRQSIRWLTPATVGGGLMLLLVGTPWARDIFLTQGWHGGYVLLLSLIGAFTITPIMIRLGHRWGFLDIPSERKIHAQATPRIGGVAVFLGLMYAFWIGISPSQQGMWPILLSGSLLLVVGLLDDGGGLPAWMRLAAQLIGAGLVVASGTVLTLFPSSPLGEVANIVITLIWIVGITNAFNFFDGMDGLATGLAVLMAFFLALVALETQQTTLGWMALAIVGACLGFLPYNLRLKRQALVFLGDGGATFLGFTLACLAVKGHWAESHPIVSFTNPLLIFGVLIYDMIHITLERIATGKVTTIQEWIDYVGKDHLHHRLERALGSRLASIGMIFGLTISLGLAALVLRKAGATEAILLLTQAALIVMMVTILEHAGRHRS